ncbi:12000_t:CDS:1, partial [Cetraspora pellucida]
QSEASEKHLTYLKFTNKDASIFASAKVEIRKNNPIETQTKKQKVDKKKEVLIKEIVRDN